MRSMRLWIHQLALDTGLLIALTQPAATHVSRGLARLSPAHTFNSMVYNSRQ